MKYSHPCEIEEAVRYEDQELGLTKRNGRENMVVVINVESGLCVWDMVLDCVQNVLIAYVCPLCEEYICRDGWPINSNSVIFAVKFILSIVNVM